MKKHLLIPVLILALLVPGLKAQDKIYSLALKEHEIEKSIRDNLSSYLEKKDYVVKVRLTGTKKIDAVTSNPQGVAQQAGEALPGFEFEDEIASAKITDIVGNQYWQISKMRIDLVMHKEISPSVDTFIRETIPVISDLNPGRGDIFNFVPILPKSLDDEKIEEEILAEGTASIEKKYYGLTNREWIYVGIGVFFLLIVLFLIWKLTRMRRNLMALEEAIEGGQIFERETEPHKNLETAEKEKQERLEQQETIIMRSILKEKNDKLIEEVITKLLGRADWCEQLYVEFSSDKQSVDKMSRFFNVLGPSTSRKLFSNVMKEESYLEMEKMAGDIKDDPEQDHALLQEVQKILFTKTLTSPEKNTFDPFSFLKDLSTGQISFLIKDEPVKIKAIVLSQLKSIDSAEILAKLPKEERGKVVQQLGNMASLPLELAEKVAYNLADKSKDVPGDSTVGFDGVDMVVEVISDSDARTRKDMINSLRVSDRDLSEKVESRFFLFDSIPVVPKDTLTDVVRRLPPEDVITAIAGSSKQLQEKVIMCFPEKNRRTLVSSLKAQTPSADVTREKQKLIVRAMQRLARENKTDLRKIQAAWAKATAKKPQAKSA
jgi:flagellar motor switch protein FliG